MALPYTEGYMEPSPTLAPQQPVRLVSRAPRRLLIGVAVAALIILIGLLAWWVYSTMSDRYLFPAKQQVSIALGVGPVGSWFMIDSKRNTLELATLLDEQTSLYVVDYVVVGDTTYALIVDGTTSSLVSQTADGARTTLSGNDTFKFGLTHDAVSGTFAYSAVPTRDDARSLPNVVVFDPRNGSERVVAKGHDAVLLPGALAVLFRVDNQLHIVSPEGTELALLTLAEGLPFAVSANRERVAIYNPTTKSVDEYSLANNTFGYGESYASPQTPQALMYVDSRIVGFSQSNSSLLAFGVGNRAKLQEAYQSPIPQALPRDIMNNDK